MGTGCSLCIVPVILSHPTSSKAIETYALLDNGSQGTFIRKDLIKQLQILGTTSTTLTIKTMTGERKETCLAVDDLEVSAV